MTDRSDIHPGGASRLPIDLDAPSALPSSVNILITSTGATASSTGIVADLLVTGTMNVYGADATSSTEPGRLHRPEHVPQSISDLDMLARVAGRSIRNKELHVPFSDED
jgi:hypothetical protein